MLITTLKTLREGLFYLTMLIKHPDSLNKGLFLYPNHKKGGY
ncbi:Hypothetical Protein SLY_0226 [Strawberry lethal yellows phytoplasma (CPA) str. NZSb11]|uniref:Uncharacterized protein n=1 Tax=Strawberry lethal yellows phytoplasma (CPA) str. NZSb11 TaxID=980422 RepID=R4S070_PHYAS|nr:Hypothetical Protein SLY_0226 [Strawberry lethal yellows phytoplasma (CPA) str. NZSb11]